MDEKIEILFGKDIAKKITQNLKNEVGQLPSRPRLDIILIGESLQSQKYVALKVEKGEEVGIEVVLHKFEVNEIEDKIISQIKELNENPLVTGIMVQLPLPANFNTLNIIKSINIKKDVDGLTPENLGGLFCNDDSAYLSATALAVETLIDRYHIKVKGKNVAMLGTSIEVGLPISAILLKKGASVYMCNINTKNIESKTKNSDIIITATGNPNMITSEYLSKNSIVIDVGYSLVNGKVYGDVDFESSKKVASKISPVPGGIGPLTVVSLFSNVVKAYKNNVKQS